MTVRNKRWRWGIITALVLLFVLIWLQRSPNVAVSSASLSSPPNADPRPVAEQPRSSSATIQKSNHVPPDQRTLAREVIELTARGYKAVVQAQSYRRTMTSRYSNNTYGVFILTRGKSPSGTDLFRSEIKNYKDGESTPMPGLTRIEITNSAGDWEWSDQAGVEDVAFLHTTRTNPADTIGSHNEFIGASLRTGDEADLENYTYSMEPTNVHGVPAIEMTMTGKGKLNGLTQTAVVNAATGAMIYTTYVSPGMTHVQQFELDIHPSGSEFEIPDSKIPVPTRDVNSSKNYILDAARSDPAARPKS